METWRNALRMIGILDNEGQRISPETESEENIRPQSQKSPGAGADYGGSERDEATVMRNRRLIRDDAIMLPGFG